MKISRQSPKRKKYITIISIVVAVLLLVTVGFAYGYHIGPFQTDTKPAINLSPATSDQKNAGDAQKKTTADQSTKVTPDSTPPDNAESGSEVLVTITALNQNNTVVQIRSLIEAVSDNGICTLTMTKGSTTLTRTSGTQAQPSSSTCKGFDIPTNELSIGSWNVTMSVNINGNTGSATGKITIQ